MMHSLPDVRNLQAVAAMIESPSKIKVLTPVVDIPDNKYLACLWSSVQPYGVEVAGFQISELIAQERKANQKTGDVLHLHWISKYCNFDGPSLKRKAKSALQALKNLNKFFFLRYKGYQIVWTVHNTLSHDCSAPLLEHGFRWVLSRLCNDVIVMSEYSRQQFARMYGRTKRVHVVPHGNYIGVYPNEISRTDARRQLSIAPHQTVILHLGQIRPYKGIDYLLETFNQLKNPDVVLLIAGSCPNPDLLTKIQHAAQGDPRILLQLKFIQDEDIQIYMNACNWVVLPYQKILNSGSALLALSFGRPVIVPQQGVLTELITDGKHGFCYTKERDLAATLNYAMATPAEVWQEMCIQSYALAEKFNWSKIGFQLYQIYQQGA